MRARACTASSLRISTMFSLVAVWIAAFAGCATAPRAASSVAENEVAATTPPRPEITKPQPIQPDSVATTTVTQPDAAPPQIRSIHLDEAIRIALESNLDLALARSQHEIALARADAAAKAFVPALDLSGGVSRVDGLVQGAFGDFREIESKSVTAGATLGLRVNIPARVYETFAARREVDAALADALTTEQRLVLNVIDLYENLVLAQIAVDIGNQLVESSEEFEKIVAARYQGGVGLGSDAARAQANVAASRQQREQAKNLARQTGLRLAVVLRLDPATTLEAADTELAPWQLPAAVESNAAVDAAQSRPDVEAARNRALASRQRLEARWWDLVAPELTAEWRVAGVGGEGHTAEPNTGQAVSNAAGSAGRSIGAWQNAANALGNPGVNPFLAISPAAGSAGRSYYAYKNLLGSTQQDIGGLDRQERYGIWLTWNLSLAKVDRIREQRIEAKSASLRVEKTEDAAVAEVHQSRNDITSLLQLITLANDEIRASEDNHRMSLARYRAGTAIAFEVLDAQDALAEARLKLARYTAAMNIAQARLLTAAGLVDASMFSAASGELPQ